jgi:hypothetical protein
MFNKYEKKVNCATKVIVLSYCHLDMQVFIKFRHIIELFSKYM